MNSENRQYSSKDGSRYKTFYDAQAADTRYDQRQKLIDEQKETNRLIREENNRMKNNRVNNENDNTYRTSYIDYNERGAPYLIWLILIIAPVLIFGKISIKYGIYILVTGLVIEAISAYKYNKKNKITNHFFEISLLIIAILFFMTTLVPISKVKNIISFDNGTYTILHSNNSFYKTTIKLETFKIDGEEIITGKAENLDIDKTIKITINYTEYIDTNPRINKWVNKSKTVEFNPRIYFDEKESSTTLVSENFDNLYKVSISEIFENY